MWHPRSGLDEVDRTVLMDARTCATATRCLPGMHMMELGRFCRLFLTAAPLMLPQLKGGEAHTCVSVPLAHTLFGSLCANLHV